MSHYNHQLLSSTIINLIITINHHQSSTITIINSHHPQALSPSLTIIITTNHHKALIPSSTSSLSYSFSFVWELSSKGSGRLERWLVKCSPSKWENLSLDLHNQHKKSGMAVYNYSSSSGEMGGRLADWQTQVYWAAW